VILQTAQDTKFYRRQRAIDPIHLLDTLLEVLACQKKVDVSLLHRHYMAKHHKISYAAFYEQLSKDAFVQWLRLLLARALTTLWSQYWEGFSALWSFFDDVRVHDGSSWAINDSLKEKLPGRFSKTCPAAMAIHTTFSLFKGQICQLQMAAYAESEHHFFPYAETGVLYLFDAGYVNQAELERFAQADAFYLTRGRSNLNPYVLHDHMRNRQVNKSLKEMVLKKGKNYDFQVKQKDGEYRLLLLWNPQTCCHVRFMTNVPLAYLSAKSLGKVYRLRWQVELYFKELKSFSGVGRLLSSNQNIIEGLVWASLLTCTLRRFLVLSAQQTKRLSTHKAARSSASFFPGFLKAWRETGAQAFTNLFQYLRQVMTFSNPKKPNAFTPFGEGKVLS